MNGSDDPGDPAVVGLATFARIQCSASVVARRLVVSAAHCLELAPDRVYFGGATGSAFVRVAAVHVHPRFDPDTLENDIAALALDEDAPVDPLPTRRAPLDASTVGAKVRLVGFGAPSAGDVGSDPRRRTGVAAISGVDDTSFTITPLPAQPCGGDSGGAALVERDGVEELAGVVSAGDFGCRRFASLTRVDAFDESFLRPLVDEADRTGAAPDHGCAAAPAKGSTSLAGYLAFWGLAAAVAARRAHGKSEFEPRKDRTK